MQRVFPDVTIFSSPDGAAFEIAQTIGGMLFSPFFLGIVIASCLVGGVSAQMGISRLLFAMEWPDAAKQGFRLSASDNGYRCYSNLRS